MIYRAFPCLISHKRFPNSVEVVFVRKEILSSALHVSCDAISRRVSIRQLWEVLRHSTGLLVVSFSRNCSVAVPDCEMRFLLMTSFVTLHHFSWGRHSWTHSWGVCVFSLVSAVESFSILANLNSSQISPEVAARQHMGLVEYSSAGLRSVSNCSGVKMWHFKLKSWAVARTQPVILPVRPVLLVCFFGEAACLLHWLQRSISLWSGSFCHMSHREGREF